MGLQALIFYVAITWLPAILRDGGLAAAQAGWMVSIMQFVSIPAALIAPVIAERVPSQRAVLVCAAASSAAGILGLILFADAGALPWVILLGLGQGSCISLALTLFSLRAPDSGRAAELSSMAQSVGYLLAAAGPSVFGLLRDLSGSWSVPLAALLAVTVALAAAGMGAGRDKRVSEV
jgi:CP family cyanate transporter-like MFS transporter